MGPECAESVSRHDGEVQEPAVDSKGLALRYRPRRFSDLVGQRHVAAVLKEAVRSMDPPRQILLSGGSGLGKTTTARIFAAALACEDPQDGDACGECDTCNDIHSGHHPDVIEMDAASNGGKDEIAELASRARTVPLRAAFKVYIVDEAHGLTRQGGEAFLKLLEEPPPHVVFVLATTDPDKMLSTNRGRCLELELLPPSPVQVAEHLVTVSTQQGWELPLWAAEAIVDRSDSRLGVRGALMSLSKLSGPLARHEVVTDETLSEYLGLLPQARIDALCHLVNDHRVADALEMCEALSRSHGDDAVRRGLSSWARKGLRLDPTSPTAVRRVELCAETPVGSLWTEALVARLSSVEMDTSPQAVVALVAESRDLLAGLQAAIDEGRQIAKRLSEAPTPPPAGAAPPTLPAGAGTSDNTPPADATNERAKPVTSSTPMNAPRSDLVSTDQVDPGYSYEPDWDEGEPYDPGYDPGYDSSYDVAAYSDDSAADGFEPDWADNGPDATNDSLENLFDAPSDTPARPTAHATGPLLPRTVGGARSTKPASSPKSSGSKSSGSKSSGTKSSTKSSGTSSVGGTRSTKPQPASISSTPQPVPKSDPDPWFDDPDASDTRPATAPPRRSESLHPDPEVDAVLRRLRASAERSFELVSKCEVVLQDGAMFVVVPSALAEQVRRSKVRDHLTSAASPLPVHFRRR